MRAAILPEARTLRIGDAISNLREVRADVVGPSGLGTVGFFAARNGPTARREVVLVSNHHVLFAHGAGTGDPVFCPKTHRRDGVLVIGANDLAPVAELIAGGAEGHRAFAYRDEPARDYFVDCAMARLPGTSTPHLGAWLPDGPRLDGIGRLHPLDVLGSRAPRVRIFGARGPRTGRVFDVAATVRAGGIERRHNVVIRLDVDNPVEPGDSGALVVDDRDRAVALVWGRNDRDPTIGYACHIHPVLDRLDVTILTRGLS